MSSDTNNNIDSYINKIGNVSATTTLDATVATALQSQIANRIGYIFSIAQFTPSQAPPALLNDILNPTTSIWRDQLNPASLDPLYTAFFASFVTTLKLPLVYPDAVNASPPTGGSAAPLTGLGDWQDLLNTNSNGNLVTPTGQSMEEFIKSAFKNAVTAFFNSALVTKNFPTNLPTNPSDVPSFINTAAANWFMPNWKNFLTGLTTLSTETPGAVGNLNYNALQSTADPTASDQINANLISYREVYFAFVPGATEENYKAFLKNFYNTTQQANGYFIPSQFLGQFFAATLQQQKALTKQLVTLSANSAEKTSILIEIFALLTTMTTAMQNVAAEQAKRLSFYADLEKAYTDLTQQIPNITASDVAANSDMHAESGDVANTVQQIQTTNQAYGTQLRDYRSVVQNQAQQQQTAVDQTNQAVNQQANLATTILQQMSQIIQSIFNG